MPKLSKADKKRKISQTEARRRKEVALARLREMAADQMSGKLIDRSGVESDWFEKGRLIRDGVLQISDRVSALLTNQPDASKVHKILTDELTKALHAVADAVTVH